MKRIIPEKLKITSFERLDRDDDLWLEEDNRSVPDERKSEINNIPTSGIVITGIKTFKSIIVKDPRGFFCTVSNLDELLTEITIEKGVIQEDLIYGRSNNRSTSWILLTPKMVKADSGILRSMKDLRPGEVYKLYDVQTVVYLGRHPWRSDYDGVFREHHIFAYPEKRCLTSLLMRHASYFTDTGVDDPDLYSEALGALKSSYRGNKDIAVIGLKVRSDLPQIDLSKINSVLFPSDIDVNSYGQRLTGRVALVRQVNTGVLEAISINGYVSRDIKSYFLPLNTELLPPRFTVCASLYNIGIKGGQAKDKYITCTNPLLYSPDSSITDLIDGLKRILGVVAINDNEWKCINLRGVDIPYHDVYAYYDCILNNGDIISGENLLTPYLNF